MYNPLEEERFQIGVILCASIVIVAFLTRLASERLPEAESIVASAVPEAAQNVERGLEAAQTSSNTAGLRESSVETVETAENAAIRFDAPLELTRSGQEASPAAVAFSKVRSVGRRFARTLAHQNRKPHNEKRLAKREPWQGALPNKKDEPAD